MPWIDPAHSDHRGWLSLVGALLAARMGEVNPYIRLAAQWGALGVIAVYTVYSLVDILRTDLRAHTAAAEKVAEATLRLSERIDRSINLLGSHVQSSEQTQDLLRAVCYNAATSRSERDACLKGIPHTTREALEQARGQE